MAHASETEHIFLHEENGTLIAYQSGKEIARQTRTTQQRFYADLHVWVRKHAYKGPYWRVSAQGDLVEDLELPVRVASAFDNQQAF